MTVLQINVLRRCCRGKDVFIWCFKNYRFVTEHAPLMNLTLDLQTQFDLWKTYYDGSLAYSRDFCSTNQDNCVHSIQLHNRPDYAANINALQSWKVRSSL